MEINFDEELLVKLRVDPQYDEPVLNQVLRIAIYDEYHAYNTYKKTLDNFGEIPLFHNIMNAEINHFNAIIPLLEKYNVPIPFDNWYDKIELPKSVLECCEVGVAAEIDNILMYDNLLLHSQEYPDVQDILYRLQAASYNNHLPAFRKAVQNYSTAPVSTQEIYDNFSEHQTDATAQDVNAKIDGFRNIANKLANGQMNEQDIMKLASSLDMATIGGLIVGGLGAMQLVKSMNKEKEE